MTDAPKTTAESAIRRLFDAGWSVSRVVAERLYTTREVFMTRAAWAKERADKIGSVKRG